MPSWLTCNSSPECGNMLIMTLSYTQSTNDTSLLTSYVRVLKRWWSRWLTWQRLLWFQFNLLDQWTQFLIAEALIPANQISTDDFAGALPNQTNLAIKGIVGIKAMSEIAAIVGDTARSSNYSVCSIDPFTCLCIMFDGLQYPLQSIAASYVTQWQNFATSSDGTHLTLSVRERFSPYCWYDLITLISMEMTLGSFFPFIPWSCTLTRVLAGVSHTTCMQTYY